MLESVFSRCLGRIDYYSRTKGKFYPWGSAMNGMASRLEATRQMIHTLAIEEIVETGTYRGTTTEWFAQFRRPVETVEISERFSTFAKMRLGKFENVKVVKSSSVPFLKDRISRTSADTRLLFYLDSHWEDHLPLSEELELIFSYYSQCTVLVDDFEVEDDPGYGFDQYSPSKRLTLGYISQASLPELFYFYPAAPSKEETGLRRGWIVLTSSLALANKLRALPLLREFTPKR